MRLAKRKRKDIQILEDAAKQLNVTVRYEKTSARGGLCRVDEKYHIIVDPKASDDYKAELLRSSLKKLNLSGLFLTPLAREILES
ncbi:MAG: hypothetical protein LBD73_08230 [Deferribacteraceae bacterium]|jgi:hypothetical protein|nr:hypothetical protein [Deferribacteraceae bacterium]